MQVQKSKFIDPVPALSENIDIYISKMDNCPKCNENNDEYGLEEYMPECQNCGYRFKDEEDDETEDETEDD